MNRIRKSTLLFIMMMLVLASALAACSRSGEDNKGASPSASQPAVSSAGNGESEAKTESDGWILGSEPLEFTLYGNYDWYDMPAWESLPAGKWMMENKQVNITSISSGGNTANKLNSMIAGGDLPDVIWGDRGADVERLREAGMLVAFDDYLDRYPNLKTWMGEDLNMLRSSDGKLYQFPNWYSSRPLGNAGYAVNKKIYRELGEPPLETTDDLYAYLKRVKENYPNVIPFEPHLAKDAQGLGVLMTAFGEDMLYSYLNRNILAVPEGDKLTSIFDHEVFREAQKYISRLFREKLIAQDAFTQTEDQIKEKVMQGRAAVFAGSNPMNIAADADGVLSEKDPGDGYFMIWPIHKPGLDKNNIFPGTYTSLGWNVAIITTAAKDPEKIFAFLDWWTGPEGMALQFFGPVGQYYDGFDGQMNPIFNSSYDAKAVAQLQIDQDPIMWVGNTAYIDPVKAAFDATLPEDQQDWKTKYQMNITWPTQRNATEFVNLNPQPDSEEGIIAQRVSDIFLVAYAASVMANSDAEVDAILDKASKDAESAGYAKLLEFRTKVWQENKARLAGN